jgi:hypothetical protein
MRAALAWSVGLALAFTLPAAASRDHIEVERVVAHGLAGAGDACTFPALEGVTSTCVRFGPGYAEAGYWLGINEFGSGVPSLVWTTCFYDAAGLLVVPDPLFDPYPCWTLNDIVVDSYETPLPPGAVAASVSPVGGQDVHLLIWVD